MVSIASALYRHSDFYSSAIKEAGELFEKGGKTA